MNKQFGIPGKLAFTAVGQGMPVVEVSTALCTARIALQGAQVLEWTPTGAKPVIWLSSAANYIEGKSIRGGIPVCWPWFGAHESNPDFPAHGYARTVPWSVISTEVLADDRIRLVFSLQVTDATRQWWPHNTPLQLHILLGDTLELELVTQNSDSQPVTITQALHTYFAVGDVHQVSVSGLNGCDYLDKVQDFARFTQQGEIGFSGEVDRVYLDTESSCVINDKAWQRQIHIHKRGSHSTVVWNPWHDKAAAMGDMGDAGYLSMLCVETANAASNVITLEPRDEHRLWVCYDIKSSL